MARPKPPEEKPTLLAVLVRLSGIQKMALARDSKLSRATIDRVLSGEDLDERHPGTWELMAAALSRMLEEPYAAEDVRTLAGTRSRDPLRAGEEIDAALKRKKRKG